MTAQVQRPSHLSVDKTSLNILLHSYLPVSESGTSCCGGRGGSGNCLNLILQVGVLFCKSITGRHHDEIIFWAKATWKMDVIIYAQQ